MRPICACREETPLRTSSVYGRTKRVVEDFLRDLSTRECELADGRSCASSTPPARIRRACWARRRAAGPTHLVPALCRVAAGECGELVVHGDDWDTADGTGVRDYVHVQDLAGWLRRAR